MIKNIAIKIHEAEQKFKLNPFMTIAVIIILSFISISYLTPKTYEAKLLSADRSKQEEISHPFFVRTKENIEMNIDWNMQWNTYAAGSFKIIPDDCLINLYINDVAYTGPELPFCDFEEGRTLNLREYLVPGENNFTAEVLNQNGTGGLTITRAPTDLLSNFFFYIIYICAFIAFCIFLTGKWLHANFTIPLRAILMVGIVVRTLYFLGTNYNVRAYDVDGHLEYINYLATHWALPLGHAGWEFHQQPLYHFLAAIIKVLFNWQLYDKVYLYLLQVISLGLSIFTLVIIGYIAKNIYKTDPRKTIKSILFVGFLATVPTFILLAPRINNDTLSLATSVLTIYFLLQWTNTYKLQTWVYTCIALGCALLTKSSTLPVLAVVGIALLITKKHNKEFKKCAAVLICAVVVTIGTTGFYRTVIQGQSKLVPVYVTPGLAVENTLQPYVTFNPLQIISIPYNNNWSDYARKEMIWEYLYRSVFFGEWNFQADIGWLGIFILVSNFLLLGLIALGIITTLLKKSLHGFLLFCLLAIGLLALVTFRFLHPFCSNQEIRYISYILVSVAYFLAEGCLSVKWPKVASACCITIFVAFIVQMILIIL